MAKKTRKIPSRKKASRSKKPTRKKSTTQRKLGKKKRTPEQVQKSVMAKLGALLEEHISNTKDSKYELPAGTTKIDDLTAEEAYTRLHEVVDDLVEEILNTGRPYLKVPKRSASNIVWDEMNDLLLLGKDKTVKTFHSLSSVTDVTRLVRVLEIIEELLSKRIHATKREVFYTDVKLFKDQNNSDSCIEDAAALLRTTRNSTHIVASAKGACIGRLRIRDRNDFINLEGLGSGGWSISPMLDNIEIIESDAEFILVVEKDAAMIRLSEARFWRKYPCIILTGKGAADIATRMFLKRLNKELSLPTFCLVDSDPYGHYIYSVYLRGSKRLSYESPFLATPNMHLLGVLSRDLDAYEIPNQCRLPMNQADIKRAKEMLNEEFIMRNKPWKEDLELMLKMKVKAEIQALSSHGFEYLTDEYLPEKLETSDWI
ncbi:MAG: DNA topoisomerase IV subunit A [Promethearchaeota archaeon]